LERKRWPIGCVENGDTKKARAEPGEGNDEEIAMQGEKSEKIGETAVGELETVDEAKESVDEATARTELSAKAVKLDDAEIPMYLWDEQILLSMDTMVVPKKEVTEALTTLRRLMLRYWKNKVHQDFFKWFDEQTWNNEEDKCKVLDAGRVAIKYAMKASWRDWDGVSSIFFWRWPPEFFEEVCFRLSPQFVLDPPTSKDKQRPYTDPTTEHLEKAKIKKVMYRGYVKQVSPELILSLMHFFLVSNGSVDI
jgi:hypothetical protein